MIDVLDAEIYDDGDADAPILDVEIIDDEQDEQELPEALQLLALVGTDECPYKDGGKWAYADSETSTGRLFFITQNLVHPSGHSLLTEAEVEAAVARRGMTTWAWITHDKDVYTQAEIDADACPPGSQVGDEKGDHIHAVVLRKSNVTIGAIARAFGVPPQCVEKKFGGKKGFWDLVEYLTHEHANQQEKGKYLYSRDEVHCSIPDWEDQLDEHQEKRATRAVKDHDIFKAVAAGELTLKDVREKHYDLYVKPMVFSHIKKLRGDYLATVPAPEQVLNVYIYGPGGVGKTLMAKALAKSMSERYFTVNSEKVAFEKYDGEGVIIWDDFRPGDLVRTLGGRGSMFRALSPYRDSDERVTVHVKHSSVSLINTVNIITGPLEYSEFLNALSGEYKDAYGTKHEAENLAQGWRRFPLIIPVSEGAFGIYLNKGFLNGTREYMQYEKHENFRQNLESLHRRAKSISDESDRFAAIETVEQKTVAPILAHAERLGVSKHDEITADDLLQHFEDAGTQPDFSADICAISRAWARDYVAAFDWVGYALADNPMVHTPPTYRRYLFARAQEILDSGDDLLPVVLRHFGETGAAVSSKEFFLRMKVEYIYTHPEYEPPSVPWGPVTATWLPKKEEEI